MDKIVKDVYLSTADFDILILHYSDIDGEQHHSNNIHSPEME